MTPPQRIAYLADAYEAASHIPGPRPQGNAVFTDVIRPAYRRIAEFDGAAVAAELYGMTFGDRIRQPQTDWYGRAKAGALADPGFMATFLAHQFPALRIGAGDLASLENDVTEALVNAAKKSDARACDWMATSTGSTRWTESATKGCASAGSSQFVIANGDKVRGQQIYDEAARRANAGKKRDVQQAQEVARYCASVGVPNPSIDPTSVRTLVEHWDRETIYGGLSSGPSAAAIENDTRAATDFYAQKLEATAVLRGTAVTPFLTPRVYMALVKRQCGLQ
jgi:hypothetical protein